jgi:hypothetical protein
LFKELDAEKDQNFIYLPCNSSYHYKFNIPEQELKNILYSGDQESGILIRKLNEGEIN